METSTVLAGTLNEPGIIGLMRPPEPRPETKEAVARESERNGGVDIVELSGESLQLTRTAGLNQTEQSAPAGIAQNDNNSQANPESNTFDISTLRGILSNIEASGTTTSGTNAVENLLSPTTTTNPTPGTTSTTNTTRLPETPDMTLNPTQSTTTNLVNAATVEPTTDVNKPNPVTEIVNEEKNISMPNPNTIEGQAKELNQFNTLFNISNGLPNNSPDNSINSSDVVQAQQPAQYSQQMLLQNLSSQLAQTVPPASIISVVG